MTQWEKYWIYGVLGVSILHLIRDVLQFLSIHMFLSTMFVKDRPVMSLSPLWHPINTVIIELVLIGICVSVIRRKRFGILGRVTIIASVLTVVGFLYYWFLL